MGGRLEIVIDGDLYKANVCFSAYDPSMEKAMEDVTEGSLIEIISEDK